MVKENDVIAIIIIILFIVLAAIAFGIYRLVHDKERPILPPRRATALGFD
ncbi:hypothetical protein GGR58DRAFT_498923 [Xylaria digitata]|nr:hypothetical protein GGR58DRAFT_498923 [Xylaria digitata]